MADAENPSAFPFVTLEKVAGSSAIYTQATPGMDLRDWFAGQALAETCGRSHAHGLTAVQVGSPMHPALAAKAAYELADAMIAERAKAVKHG